MNVSLIDGWFPWTVQILAVGALLGAIGWRTAQWRLRRLPIAVGISILLTVVVALATVALADITDPVPFAVWAFLGVALLALTVLVVGWRGARWWHRASVPVAVLLAVVAAANTVNISTGYYPSVDAAASELSGQPVPQQMDLDQALKTVGKTDTGRVVTVDIPDTASGFKHRQELVYLPPVWFRSKDRPKLPAMEMIGGEFALPTNWIRVGNSVQTADDYAAKHGGFAPIMVYVDATGDFKTDTECVNGPNGRAQDHLVKDVPPFVEQTFNASSDQKKWAVVGWSMGGTCSVVLVTTHNDVFKHFLDISGDIGPNLGSNKQQTVDKLFGGDAAAFDANDPLTVMAKHGTYRNTSGQFADGDSEGGSHAKSAQQLANAADKVGIANKVIAGPGKHDWQYATSVFAQQLPWLAEQLSLPGTQPQLDPKTTSTPQ